jgi:hypothetical protein
MKNLFIVLAAIANISAPTENFNAPIAPETADQIIDSIISENYDSNIDYDGNGELKINDVVNVLKRYNNNITYGNTITIDSEVVEAIAENCLDSEPIYYEFTMMNDEVFRKYDIEVSEKSSAVIYYEFEESSANIIIEVDPITETVNVLEN